MRRSLPLIGILRGRVGGKVIPKSNLQWISTPRARAEAKDIPRERGKSIDINKVKEVVRAIRRVMIQAKATAKAVAAARIMERAMARADRKSTRLNSSHGYISYAVFCLKKKNR